MKVFETQLIQSSTIIDPSKKSNIFLSRGEHLQIVDQTVREEYAHRGRARTAPGATMQAGIRVGYYRQIFVLNFEETVNESLVNAITASGEPLMKSTISHRISSHHI
jgi:hypothetical protein